MKTTEDFIVWFLRLFPRLPEVRQGTKSEEAFWVGCGGPIFSGLYLGTFTDFVVPCVLYVLATKYLGVKNFFLCLVVQALVSAAWCVGRVAYAEHQRDVAGNESPPSGN